MGKFSAIELNKQLAGKKAGINLYVNNYSNGMSGYCSPKDIETMLQLLYQNFTSPRFSEEDFNTTMDSYKAYVQNLTSNPDYIMQIETIKTLYSDNPRQQPLTIDLAVGVVRHLFDADHLVGRMYGGTLSAVCCKNFVRILDAPLVDHQDPAGIRII